MAELAAAQSTPNGEQLLQGGVVGGSPAISSSVAPAPRCSATDASCSADAGSEVACRSPTEKVS